MLHTNARWTFGLPWPMVVALVVAVSGCGGVIMPRYTLGPHTLEPQTVFTRSAESLRAQGYTLTVVDGPHGRIVATSHYVDRRGRSATFTVQCYRAAWIAIEVAGPMVRENQGRFSLPGDLGNEYLDLVMFLGASVGVIEVVGGES